MKKDIRYQLLMILAMSIWGGSWVVAKSISHSLHFQKLALVRFALTFVFFIPPMLYFKQNFRINRTEMVRIVIGGLLYTLYSQMFFLGLHRGMASIGGILVTSLVPIITFAAMSAFYRVRIRSREGIGLAMGLCGSLIILRIWSIHVDELLSSGNMFFLAGALLWSGVTINSQKTQASMSIWSYSFYLNGVAMLMQTIFVVPLGFHDILPADVDFWLYMIYLSLFSTVFATSLYFYSTKLLGSHRASAFTFMVPASAITLSWIFLSEALHPATVIGGLMTLAGVYLTQQKKWQRY